LASPSSPSEAEVFWDEFLCSLADRGPRGTDYTLGLYASTGYIARRGRPDSVADLARHELVGYVEDLIYTPELNYASDILADWRSTIEVATAIGQVEAVRMGAGIGVLHDFMVAGLDLEPLLHLGARCIVPWTPCSKHYWRPGGIEQSKGATRTCHDLV
jgi:DNA-binding transcriptional LysR family regulator